MSGRGDWVGPGDTGGDEDDPLVAAGWPGDAGPTTDGTASAVVVGGGPSGFEADVPAEGTGVDPQAAKAIATAKVRQRRSAAPPLRPGVPQPLPAKAI